MLKLLREPLLHFLLLGALLFVVYSLMNPAERQPDDAVIEVSPELRQRLADAWARQWRRPPDEAEMAGLIEDFVREEVLYREALALGLDRDDTIIRRRLAQKMEFLTEDFGSLAEPTEEELRGFFDANAGQFAEPARVSFEHIYFSPDQRGTSAREDAALVLEELRAAGPADVSDRGDRFLMQRSYSKLAQRDASQLFGEKFAAALFGLPANSWEGPVESGFGWHLVRVSSIEPQRVPDFAAVRDRVRVEFDYQRQRESRDAVYQELRSRYEVRVPMVGADN